MFVGFNVWQGEEQNRIGLKICLNKKKSVIKGENPR